ncbi:hypothetical protein P9314_09455 [Paenibacillus validus]|uniref:Uncharacterized protein n=1 Tax=Paenibacillus validus TaxID=44253 RepID=A0A7X2ZEW6_9BACL|nr:hypothetical protein [Paenibacillus validus]MED4600926.1 hypothetical protein [Paenibacillus validus]MED4607220.1 hypothetical protein [Paenibacillus validus]MUG73664.1 hypothetical protein [Paenibacillus validus]
MKPIITSFVLLFVILPFIAECSKTVPEPQLTTKKLYELYPGDIQKVDYIEIRSGETGHLKTYTDKNQIQDWIGQVRNFKFVPDPNQEDRSGFLYGVSLFENKELKLGFTPNSTGGHYYIYNEELKNKIQELYESKQ